MSCGKIERKEREKKVELEEEEEKKAFCSHQPREFHKFCPSTAQHLLPLTHPIASLNDPRNAPGALPHSPLLCS